MEKKPVVEIRNISKKFGKVQANKDVSLDLYAGEILSVLGENGSGKTSLMNILAGIYFPDEGSIKINDKKVSITSPKVAYSYHIGMVHQHFKLIDTFTATENVVVGLDDSDYKDFRRQAMESELAKFEKIKTSGREPSEAEISNFKRLMRSTKGYNLKESEIRINRICSKYGFMLDTKKRVSDMSVSEKQTLEIIKVLYRGVDFLILDEPTAVLSPQEIEKLFKILRNMRDTGKSVIIITHKLNEVMDISDRIAVLRKGEMIGCVNKTETNIEQLTEMMIGKKTELNIKRSKPLATEKLLEVKNLCVKNYLGNQILTDISFDLYNGEILGIAGISGNGQKELLEAIAGVNNITNGDVIYHRQKKNKPVSFTHKSLKEIKVIAEHGGFHDLKGNPVHFKKTIANNSNNTAKIVPMSNKEIKNMVNNKQVIFNNNEIMNLRGRNPKEIRELGIHLAFVPEDRLGMGLVGNMNIVDNMLLRAYRKGKGPFLRVKNSKDAAEDIIKQLEVVTSSASVQVKKLSGGNVQKVLVGREIKYAPSVFMVAYPVRGLDINSSYTIYNLLNKQKESGVGIIYVGEDIDVLLELADRILVLYDGKVRGILDARKTNKKEIGSMMVGQ